MAPAPDNELLSDQCCCEIELEVQVTSADLENDNYIKATSLNSAVLKIPISLFFEETAFFNPLPLIETEEIPFPTIHTDQIATANSQLYLTTARLRL